MTAYKFHPLADIFPLMEGAEFAELVADIKKNGLHEDIVLFNGMILDGRNRYRACLAADVPPTTYSADHLITDPAAYVISANIHRRHLNAEDRQKFLIQVIAATPEKSDRTLAKETGLSHPTIAKARKQGEATGKVLPVEKRAGADGKVRKQPVVKKRRTPEQIRSDKFRHAISVFVDYCEVFGDAIPALLPPRREDADWALEQIKDAKRTVDALGDLIEQHRAAMDSPPREPPDDDGLDIPEYLKRVAS